MYETYWGCISGTGISIIQLFSTVQHQIRMKNILFVSLTPLTRLMFLATLLGRFLVHDELLNPVITWNTMIRNIRTKQDYCFSTEHNTLYMLSTNQKLSEATLFYSVMDILQKGSWVSKKLFEMQRNFQSSFNFSQEIHYCQFWKPRQEHKNLYSKHGQG